LCAKAFVEEQESVIAATGLRGDLIEDSPSTIGAIDDPMMLVRMVLYGISST
jgi:hypothetical protein